MKKILFLLFFIPFCLISANAAGYDVEEKLSRLEYSAFSKTFSGDELSSRLARLETEYFGAKQSGTLDNRLDKLMKNVYFCDTPLSEDYSSMLYQTPETITSSKGIKGFWNRIKNDFDMGSFTGYTPPITNSYDTYHLYGGGNSSIYTPFSSPFYQNKFNRTFDNFRTNKKTGRNNPFMPKSIGVSNRPNSAFYNYNPIRKSSIYNPRNHYRPTDYNSKTSIGTRVILLD